MNIHELEDARRESARAKFGENPFSEGVINRLLQIHALQYSENAVKRLKRPENSQIVQRDLDNTRRANSNCSPAFAAGLYISRTVGTELMNLMDHARAENLMSEFIMWHDFEAGYGQVIKPLVNFEHEVSKGNDPASHIIDYELRTNPQLSRKERNTLKAEARAYMRTINDSLKTDPTGIEWVNNAAEFIHNNPNDKPFIGIPQFLSAGALFAATVYKEVYGLFPPGKKLHLERIY